jgi:hypothetical protein
MAKPIDVVCIEYSMGESEAGRLNGIANGTAPE